MLFTAMPALDGSLSSNVGLVKGWMTAGPSTAGPRSGQAFSVDGKAQEPCRQTEGRWDLIQLIAE